MSQRNSFDSTVKMHFSDESSQETKTTSVEIPLGYKLFFTLADNHLFRLVVDGCQQKEGGFVAYETREKGSIQNVLQAIVDGIDTNIADITVRFLKDIHKTCRHDLRLEVLTAPGGEFITDNFHGCSIYHITLDGLSDLCEFAKKYPSLSPQLEISLPTYLPQPITRKNIVGLLRAARHQPLTDFNFNYIVSVSAENSERITKILVAELQTALKLAKNDNDIIHAIVNFVYDFEHLHPFGDVNLRTNIVLADIILMQYGFPPVSYDDPNFLDGCSKQEFFNIIKNGMLKTLEMIKNPHQPYFGFNSSELTESQQIQYQEIITPVVHAKAGHTFKISPTEIESVEHRVNSLTTYSPSPAVLSESHFSHKISRKFQEIDILQSIKEAKAIHDAQKHHAKKQVVKEKKSSKQPKNLREPFIDILANIEGKQLSELAFEVHLFLQRNNLTLNSLMDTGDEKRTMKTIEDILIETNYDHLLREVKKLALTTSLPSEAGFYSRTLTAPFNDHNFEDLSHRKTAETPFSDTDASQTDLSHRKTAGALFSDTDASHTDLSHRKTAQTPFSDTDASHTDVSHRKTTGTPTLDTMPASPAGEILETKSTTYQKK